MAQRIARFYWGILFAQVLALSMTSPIYSLYLREAGLSFAQLGFVNMCFMATIVVFEIPTGIVADVLGRKLSWLLSLLFSGLGMMLYSQMHSLPGFILAEVFVGIGLTFSSGALTAWVIDEISHHGGGISNIDVLGKGHTLGNLAHVAGALLGGFVGTITLSSVWLVGGALHLVIAVVSAKVMAENGWQRKKTSSTLARQMVAQWKEGYQSIRRHQNFAVLFVAGMILAFSVQGFNMQWAPHFRETLPIWGVGIFAAGMFAFLAAGSYLATRLNNRLASPKGMTLIFVSIAAPMVFAALFPPLWGMLPFMVHELGRGGWVTTGDVWVNNHLSTPHARATVLSVGSMMKSLGAVIGLLATGVIADRYGIPVSWLLGSGVIIMSTLIFRRLSTEKGG